jgi:uncharacterized protein
MKPAKQPGTYALVTGGSHGIGKAIAGALANEGYNLLLAALPDEALEAAAETLRNIHGCEVKTLGIDLRHDGADRQVGEWVLGLDVPVTVLVNNAGFGHLGAFGQFPRDFYHDLLQVNVLNTVGITRLLMGELQSRGGYILNVGSIASFFPIPYKTVYASSKYFMYAFSRGLREEMRGSGLSVSLLCPGPVYTNAEVNARINCAGKIGRWMALQPPQVGEKAVRRMLKGRWLITPGISSRLALVFRHIMPSSLLQRQMAGRFSRDQRAI